MSMQATLSMLIPDEVRLVLQRLHKAGYQAYLVGGCLRDAMLKLIPFDWDVATNAIPTSVIRMFPGAKGVGAAFGTVVLPTSGIQITTFRRDLAYKDSRHPIGVEFGDDIIVDLHRRDFTINAMAWDVTCDRLIDPTGGAADLQARLIRAVGDPEQRFSEDALRLMRMVRFAAKYDMDIAEQTWQAAEASALLINKLSKERVGTEFLRILEAVDAGRGLWILHELGMLVQILPELAGGERLRQGKSNAPTLLDHLIQAAAECPAAPLVRLAALLHDVGKMTTRTLTDTGRVMFPKHEEYSAQLAAQALQRLRFDGASIAYVQSLIRHHMWSGPLQIATMRRWLAKYGENWVHDLIMLWQADYQASGGSGNPLWLATVVENWQRLIIEEGAMKPSSLAINGNQIMTHLGIGPGPVVGQVLASLYEYILVDPQRNTLPVLLTEAKRIFQEQGDGRSVLND